jgi:hypothetical protein
MKILGVTSYDHEVSWEEFRQVYGGGDHKDA